MLFSGCWAVRVEPPVWVWNRSRVDSLVLGPEALGHDLGPHPPGGPVLGHLLEEVVVGVPEEAEPGSERVDVESGGQRRLHVGDPVGDGEGDLLHGRRTGLADVVAGDGDGVPGRQVVCAVGEGVGDQPHRRAGRVDVGAPGHVLLQDVVLDGAPEQGRVDPVLLGHQLVEEQQDGGGGVDGHRGGDLVEREPGQQEPHVGHRVDGHPHLSHLALGTRMVRVVAHLGGEVEGARQAGLARIQQELEPLVGRLGRAEPGVLAHGPQPPPVHVGPDAPGVGVLTGRAQTARRDPSPRGPPARRPGAISMPESVYRLSPGLFDPLSCAIDPGYGLWRRPEEGAGLRQPATGASSAWGMHRSSYSAMTIGAASAPQAGHSGSRWTLKVRKLCSRAS